MANKTPMFDEIRQLIDGKIAVDKRKLKTYSHDTSLFEIVPQAIVYPKNVRDVKNLVKYTTNHKRQYPHLSLTARSGGTDMSGGSINDSLIVAFERYFKKTGAIRHNRIAVEPGVYYRNFEKKTLRWGKIMPAYPASRDICAVGGMVANNTGGEKSFFYGKTEKYVKRLKVVLADGNEYVVKPVKGKELKKKIAQKDFEGKLYREVYNLVDRHYDKIKAAKPPVSKNSTGYNLWNIWDRETGIFDLTQLFVGSQGTLGIITEIEFGLVDVMPKSGMLIGYMPSLDDLGNMVNTVIKHNPTSIEAFDDQTIRFVFKFFPKFRGMLGNKEFIKLAVSLIPDGFIILRKGIPRLVFLVEFEADTQEEIDHKLHELEADLAGYDITTEMANNKAKSKRFWLMRRKSFALLRENVGKRHTAPFIDDLVVPPDCLEDFLPKLQKIVNKYDLLETIAGHLGDGNFHIIPLMDLRDKKERDKIEPCLREVIKLVKEYDGSMSGEHNDGLIRGPFIREMYGEEIYGHFKRVKHAFDPYNIFNPHKKTDASWQFSSSHIRNSF